jgi:hypothetical protein
MVLPSPTLARNALGSKGPLFIVATQTSRPIPGSLDRNQRPGACKNLGVPYRPPMVL